VIPLQLCPDYEGLELGIGESLLMKAICESSGKTLAAVKAEYKKIGDLGMVAQVNCYGEIRIMDK
jgi:DNA ligase 1